MADVTIKYKGQSIATMDASGSKTLGTQGKYCEGDIAVEYAKPAGPTGTKSITITENGTTTEDVAAYANAEITVDVQGGGGFTIDDFADGTATTGELVITSDLIESAFNTRTGITKVVYTGRTLPTSAFYNCTGLTEFHAGSNFPSSLSSLALSNNTFDGCSSLVFADLGNLPAIRNMRTFNNCSKLKTIILRSQNLVTMPYNVNVFNNTPFKSGGTGGTIYIPKALYDHLGDGSALDYKAATNWSVYDGYGTITWAQIEGSQYETPVAGYV